MSNIIAFKADPGRSKALLHGEQPGRILLFTGVRYMRQEDETAGPVVDVHTLVSQPADQNPGVERLHA